MRQRSSRATRRPGVQVWSGDSGYPGDGNYLDFHKKRWPGGHRYWSVSGPKVDMADKQPYNPQIAAEKTKSHAAHYVHLIWEALHEGFNDAIPPVLCSPFDAELCLGIGGLRGRCGLRLWPARSMTIPMGLS